MQKLMMQSTVEIMSRIFPTVPDSSSSKYERMDFFVSKLLFSAHSMLPLSSSSPVPVATDC